MTSLYDYLEDVVNIFASISPFAEFAEEPVVETLGSELGILIFSLKFTDGSILDFTATLDFSTDYPVYSNYSVHYQNRQCLCIFRYDNAPHHPELTPFPQHKHVGERAIDGELPSMRQIAREIEVALQQ
mgnify:CR=1 FL=1